jgi:hypothetical protein
MTAGAAPRKAALYAAGVPPQPPQHQPRHSLHPLLPPPGTTTRRTRTTYLCFNRGITSVGAHPGELIFSKHLAFFVIFVIFYILVIYDRFYILVIFSIFSISSIFCIFDISHIFDIYITKSKLTYICHI